MTDTPKTPCPTAQALRQSLQMDRIGLAGPVQQGDHDEAPRAYVNANGFAVATPVTPTQAATWINQRRS